MAQEKDQLASIRDNFLTDFIDNSEILRNAGTLLINIWTQQTGDFDLSRPITIFSPQRSTILRIFRRILQQFPFQTLQFLRKWV